MTREKRPLRLFRVLLSLQIRKNFISKRVLNFLNIVIKLSHCLQNKHCRSFLYFTELHLMKIVYVIDIFSVFYKVFQTLVFPYVFFSPLEGSILTELKLFYSEKGLIPS